MWVYGLVSIDTFRVEAKQHDEKSMIVSAVDKVLISSYSGRLACWWYSRRGCRRLDQQEKTASG